jgi:hypothetical protein
LGCTIASAKSQRPGRRSLFPSAKLDTFTSTSPTQAKLEHLRTFPELRPARIRLLSHYVQRSDPIRALPRLREADEACPHNSEAWRAARAARFLLCSLQPCRDERAGTGRLALSPFRCHKPACEAPLLLPKRLAFLSTIEGALRPITLAWPAAGLVVGLAAKLSGWGQWAGPIWAIATIPVLVVLLAEIVVSLRRGDVG